MSDYKSYLDMLTGRFNAYVEDAAVSECIDPDKGKGYVFLREHEELNLFQPGLAEFMPANNRHQWFRSMMSSQALAASVLGTIANRGGVPMLSGLLCDDGLPLFEEKRDLRLMSLEYVPKWLEMGGSKTQIDAYLEFVGWRVAIECKFTESDIGHCEMSDRGERKEAYRDLPGYDFCYRVAYNGAAYWRYWPYISNLAVPEECSDTCPMLGTYQLARNVMCAGIDQDSGGFDGMGKALLLYDGRNPEFQGKGKAVSSYESLKKALIKPEMLRSATWQSLIGLLGKSGGYEDLLEYLGLKYGLGKEF